jgi:hypothetical protein
MQTCRHTLEFQFPNSANELCGGYAAESIIASPAPSPGQSLTLRLPLFIFGVCKSALMGTLTCMSPCIPTRTMRLELSWQVKLSWPGQFQLVCESCVYKLRTIKAHCWSPHLIRTPSPVALFVPGTFPTYYYRVFVALPPCQPYTSFS